MWAANNITHANMLFYPVQWYNKPTKTKNHTELSFVTWFWRKSNCHFEILKFEIANIRIIEGSDNGNSDNWGSTIFSSTLPFKNLC